MSKNQTVNSILLGIGTAILSFGLFYNGVAFILKSIVTPHNMIAYALLSFILGTIAFGLYGLRLKTAFYIFSIGNILGFAYMYYVFSLDTDGWGDLAGLLSYFIIATTGLGAGIIIQVLVYLSRRGRKKSVIN